MDINTILEVIIAVAALLVTAFLIPFLRNKKSADEWQELLNKVEIAVSAAEQIFDYKDNDKKYNYVDKIIASKFPALSVYERQMLIERTVQEFSNIKNELVE